MTNIFQLGGNHHLDNYMAIYYMSNWGYTKLIGVETPFITGGGPHSKDLMQPRRFLADRNMAKGKKATVSFFKDVLPREKKNSSRGHSLVLLGFISLAKSMELIRARSTMNECISMDLVFDPWTLK